MSKRSPLPKNQTFNANATFVVRRQFKMSGRMMTPGMTMSRKNNAVSHQFLWKLFNAGYLAQTSDGEATETATEARVAPEAMSTPAASESPVPTPSPSEDDGAEPDLDPDELDEMSFKDLQAMAESMGVAKKHSKKAQIEAILDLEDE